jgi:hypothetical protein
MSGAVFKKLMAEMRSEGMYLYFSKLARCSAETQRKVNLPQIYAD